MELTPITQKLCRKCKYSVNMCAGSHYAYCFYSVRTGHSRTLYYKNPPGLCDKFEDGRQYYDKWNNREKGFKDDR